jgi:sorbitol-specific phosphotransferase system component IIA
MLEPGFLTFYFHGQSEASRKGRINLNPVSFEEVR